MSQPVQVAATEVVGRRTIGWFTAACLLVSNVIGGAIFTTTGFLARDLGDPWVILGLWIAGGVLALAGAMCYAELGAALPRAGGDYVYLREAYGPLVGFLSGWTSFAIGFGAAIAASSVAFASYVLRLWPSMEDTGLLVKAFGLLLLWSLTAVHAAGLGAGGTVQRLLTTIKVTAIFALLIAGALFGEGSWSHLAERAPDAVPKFGPLVVGLIFVMYSYFGWNVAGYVAGEIADPRRTLPSIMIGGVAFVATIYVFLNLLYVYALPVKVLGEAPVLPVAEKAAAALWGPASARVVTVMLCIAIAGGVSAMVWAGPRVYWAMARDGVFAPFLAVVSPTSGAPVRAILLQSLWASCLIVTGTFEQLVIYSGFVLTAFSALTVTALIVLRRRQPALHRPFRVPCYPLVPGLFIMAALVIVGESLVHRTVESAWGLATIGAGMPLYWLVRQRARGSIRC